MTLTWPSTEHTCPIATLWLIFHYFTNISMVFCFLSVPRTSFNSTDQLEKLAKLWHPSYSVEFRISGKVWLQLHIESTQALELTITRFFSIYPVCKSSSICFLESRHFSYLVVYLRRLIVCNKISVGNCLNKTWQRKYWTREFGMSL